MPTPSHPRLEHPNAHPHAAWIGLIFPSASEATSRRSQSLCRLGQNCVRAMATQADGHAKREAALLMLADEQQVRLRRITVDADEGLTAPPPGTRRHTQA